MIEIANLDSSVAHTLIGHENCPQRVELVGEPYVGKNPDAFYSYQTELVMVRLANGTEKLVKTSDLPYTWEKYLSYQAEREQKENAETQRVQAINEKLESARAAFEAQTGFMLTDNEVRLVQPDHYVEVYDHNEAEIALSIDRLEELTIHLQNQQ